MKETVYEIHAYGKTVSRDWFINNYRNGDEVMESGENWIDFVERVPYEYIIDYMENDVECMRTIVLQDDRVQIYETAALAVPVDEYGIPIEADDIPNEAFYIGNATRIITRAGEEIFADFDSARERALYLLGLYE